MNPREEPALSVARVQSGIFPPVPNAPNFFSWAAQLVDRLVGVPQLSIDPEQHRRLRLLVWVCWLCSLSCCIGAGSVAFISGTGVFGFKVLALSSLWFGVLPFLLKYRVPLWMVSLLFGIWFAGSSFLIGWGSRGLHTTAVQALLTLPLTGFLLGGTRMGMLYTGMGMVIVVVFLTMHLTDYPFMVLPPTSKLAILRAITYFLLLFSFALIVWFYENARMRAQESADQAQRQLVDARDAAEQANHSKSSFLANVSHELRTPLNAIIGYTELVEEMLMETPQAHLCDDLRKVHGAGQHLLTLINDLLDISKIEANKLELQREVFSLSDLLAEIRSTFEPLLQQNRNTFHLVFAAEPAPLYTDRMRLKQILLNLVSNANKFTKEGDITIHVNTLQREGGERLVLTVQDTGIGMSEEQLQQIFEPFEQGGEHIAQHYGGTGLGLALTLKLSELMGGGIEVKSNVGKGSRFSVFLPSSPLV